MKIFSALFLSLLIVGIYIVHIAEAEQPLMTDSESKVDAGRSSKKYSIGQFLDTTSYRGGFFTFDETRLLYSSDETGIFNIFSMKIDGGQIKKLTASDNHARTILTTFPNDNRFLYESDGLGNELSHIWMQNPDGTVRDLTPIDNARFEFYGWSYDGLSFFYGSNQRDAKYFDLYEMNIKTFTPVLKIQNDAGWQFGDISNDKRFVSLIKVKNANDNNLYIYDLQAQQMIEVVPHTEEANYYPACFSTDSNELYFITNEDHDFSYLKKYDLKTGKIETTAKYDWDVSAFGISYRGRYQITFLNQDAKASIRIFDVQTQSFISLPDFTNGGEILQVKVSKSEKWMLFYVNGSRSPGNLYIYDLVNKNCRQLTNSLCSEMDAEDLVEAKVIRFASYDGMEIPALYYQPHGIHADKKAPALIWMHGGPGGQSTVNYHYLIQYLVNHGYAVLAVNNRGSSGYGKSFFQAADLKHGEADLDDCIASKQFLISTGVIDKDKIGIIGGSYGGYLTLAALAFRPEEMAVGIDIFGVSNWIRTLEGIPAWWETKREALYQKIGHPETDRDYLLSISPLFHADKIKKPLLVIQGANDPRVLKVESDQIVEAVKRNAVPCKYVLFDDEGHGFEKKSNRQIAAESILEFLNEHLPL